MDRFSVNEIADTLGIHPKAAKSRLRRAGVQPIAYVGPTALYSLDSIERIREARGRGRPKKDKSAE
jgi:predicted ArsR family transcriptional regulator